MELPVKVTLWILIISSNVSKSSSTGCNVDDIAADVLILLDESGSMGLDNFKKETDFVMKLFHYFKIGDQNVQLGVVTFSEIPRLILRLASYNKFDTPTRRHHQEIAINAAVNAYQSAGTKTAEALDYIVQQSFTVGNGDRLDIPNILIVLTDGRSDDKLQTIKAAKNLHRNGITCIPVGIGAAQTLDMDELNEMATNSSYVNHLQSFDQLDKFFDQLKDLICELGQMAKATTTATTTKPPSTTKSSTTFKTTTETITTSATTTTSMTSSLKTTETATLKATTKQAAANPAKPIIKTSATKRPIVVSTQSSLKQGFRTSGMNNRQGTTLHPIDNSKNNNGYDNTDYENTEYEEPFEDIRSSKWMQAAEVTSIGAVAIVAIGGALCCCKQCLLCSKKREKDEDDEEKIQPSQPPLGHLESIKRINDLAF